MKSEIKKIKNYYIVDENKNKKNIIIVIYENGSVEKLDFANDKSKINKRFRQLYSNTNKLEDDKSFIEIAKELANQQTFEKYKRDIIIDIDTIIDEDEINGYKILRMSGKKSSVKLDDVEILKEELLDVYESDSYVNDLLDLEGKKQDYDADLPKEIKNLKVGRKLIKILASGLVMALAIQGGHTIFNKNKKSETDDSVKSNTTVESVTTTPVPIATPTPILEITDSLPNPDECDYVEIIENGRSTRYSYGEKGYDTTSLLEESYLRFEHTRNNALDSENYFLDRNALYINFEQDPMLTGADKAAVAYYSKLRNKLEECRYKIVTNNNSAARVEFNDEVINFNSGTVAFIGANVPLNLEVDGQYRDVYFSDLSDYGKELIIQLAEQIRFTLSEDAVVPVYDKNGGEIGSYDTYDIFNLLYPYLEYYTENPVISTSGKGSFKK